MRRFLSVLGLLAVLGTAHALPDLDRGKRALEEGDYETAQSDLQPLARRGYLEAQILLARMYAKLDTPVTLVESARWYRMALRRDPEVAIPLARVLLRTGDPALAPEADQLLRQADVRGRGIAPALRLRLYREHPQLAPPHEAEELAARLAISSSNEDVAEAISWHRAQETPEHMLRAGELCEQARSWLPECYSDLARAYRARNETAKLEQLQEEARERHESGWLPTEQLERMARSLVSDHYPGQPMKQAAYRMLDQVAAAPGAVPATAATDARLRMAKMLLEQPELDIDADPEELLLDAAASGSMEAKYYLGRLNLEGNRPRDPAQALRLLEQAAPTTPMAHYHLGRLHERGYLGTADPERAFQHYIAAARAGYARADLALAQMYWTNRGVRVDPVNAYTFARLAVHYEVPDSHGFLATLHQQLTHEQIALGQHKAELEFRARQARLEVPDGTPADAPAESMAFAEERR